jgi:hypothetical protein
MLTNILSLVVVVGLLQSAETTSRQREIEALESLYNSTGGSAGRWNFSSMNERILKYAPLYVDLVPDYAAFAGAAWDFKKNATGYEMDPCAVRSSGENFAGIGCTCSDSNMCNITRIGLPCGNLAGSLGSIVAALQNFTQLSTLGVDTNALTGTIPYAIGTFPSLVDLQIQNNLLQGSIPSELGQLTNVKGLFLHRYVLLE